MGTVIVGLIIAGFAVLAVKTILKNRKNGKTCHCSGNCSSCGMNCSQK